MRTLTSLIAILAITATAGVTWAQDDYDDTTTGILFGPQVGVSKSPDEDATVIGGAALRLRLLRYLGLEGSVNYHQEEFAGDALTVRSWPVQVTGMVYPLPIVYGAMGAGWYMTTLDFDSDDAPLFDDDTSNEFGWHFGGGLEIPLGTAVVLNGDLRYVFIDYNFDAAPGSDGVDSDFYMATAGLLFRL